MQSITINFSEGKVEEASALIKIMILFRRHTRMLSVHCKTATAEVELLISFWSG